MVAVPANFQAGHHNVELAVALNLTFEPVEQIAFKLRDLAAAQAGHVDVVSLRTALVEMLLALHMHEVKLIDQAVTLEQINSPIDGDAVNLRINPPRLAQNLAGIQMLLCRLDDAQNSPPLMGHAQPARHQFSL